MDFSRRICCFFAVHSGFSIQNFICRINFSPKVDGVRLSMIQFLVTGLLTAIPMFTVDMQHSISGIEAWGVSHFIMVSVGFRLLYAGKLCHVVWGYTLQIIGQNGLNPTVASLIMSLEAVFSAVFGWLILGQKLSIKEILGCCLIFSAIILAQLPVQRKAKFAGESYGENRNE
mgnify:CR=1 FL=1